MTIVSSDPKLISTSMWKVFHKSQFKFVRNWGVLEDPIELEKIYLDKARELKKKVEGKDSGNLKNYVEVVRKYEKYSIQELYQQIMEKAKGKQKNEK